MKSLIDGLISNKTPVPFVGRRPQLFGTQHKSNAVAQMEAMGSVGTLFAIVTKLASSVAQTDWKLWRKAPSGKKEDRVEVTRHAALDLWNKPNKFYTRQEFVETFQQHLDLTGEGWWLVGRNAAFRSIPLELWPVRPDKMEPVPDPIEFISGYVYKGPDGQKIPLKLDEVIQVRMPNPLDPYRGMGPVQSILTDTDTSRYAAEWNRNFFINGAEPGGIIEVENRLSDDQFDEMRERWNEQHRGVSNAHRVAILEAGKWVDRKYTNRDMQFAELRGLTSEIIREAFGFPKPLLGSVDDVNRANAEAGEVVFARWCVVPRLDRIKQALNNDFLPLFGTTTQGLEFDYENPVPDDRTADNEERVSKANATATLINTGFDSDDVCLAMGLPLMRFTARKEVTNGQAQDGPTASQS